MEDIVAVAAALSDLGASSMVVSRAKTWALVSQLAEELDSKPRQCEFESHRGHNAASANLLRTTVVIRSRYPSV